MIKNVISYIFHYVFGAYKKSRVIEIGENSEDLTSVHVRTVKGQSITLHCKRTNYLIRNQHFLIPDFKFSIYKLYGESSEQSPEKLKKVIQKVAFFPTLRPFFLSEQNRRKFLIETYVSLLTSELENINN
jgi:hypothetical protein